jgi:hypothetical protein
MAVDECRLLEIDELCNGGRWASHPRGRIRWLEKGSRTVRARLSYAIAWEDWPPGAPLLMLELRYRPTATAPESCDRIRLEVGAARRCVARCPGCNRPVRKLYAPPSDAHFFCRDCQGLAYRRSAGAEKQARMRATWDRQAALEADLQALIGPLPGGAQALAAAGVAGGTPPEQQHDELEALLGSLASELPLAPQELRIYCLRLDRGGLSVRGIAALVGSSKSSVGRFRAAGLEGVSIWLLANERRERLRALRWSPKTMTLEKLATFERDFRRLGLHRRKASDLEVRVLTVAKADRAAASKQAGDHRSPHRQPARPPLLHRTLHETCPRRWPTGSPPGAAPWRASSSYPPRSCGCCSFRTRRYIVQYAETARLVSLLH